MGGASITVLAAALILQDTGSPAVRAARPALTAAAVGFWILASSLIPLLLGRVAWRHLLRREPVRYRADLWMIVFPCGMYATASMQLGAARGSRSCTPWGLPRHGPPLSCGRWRSRP